MLAREGLEGAGGAGDVVDVVLQVELKEMQSRPRVSSGFGSIHGDAETSSHRGSTLRGCEFKRP
jgi:hypothetical protein